MKIDHIEIVGAGDGHFNVTLVCDDGTRLVWDDMPGLVRKIHINGTVGMTAALNAGDAE